MKKISIILVLIIAFSFASEAQTEVDALRYSQLTSGGTARFLSTGGAFGAVGADFSVLSMNPAGIGFYKKSELTFTPSLFTSKSESMFNGNPGEDSKYNFNFSNVGIVLAFDADNGQSSEWKNVQFGFGMNRTNNFNNRTIISGDNDETSLMDDYILKANGTPSNELDPFDTQLAWDTYLLDPSSIGTNNYFSRVPMGGIKQTKEITSWGSMNEMVFSFGGNYNDKLYLGATMGIPYIRYTEESVYTEELDPDTIQGFKSFTVYDNLETKGSGFNFKFGMIYRINDWVRVGAAVHTPTFYSMHDNYSRQISSDLDSATYEAESPSGIYDYQLTSPMRAIGSIAFIIGKRGLISADYEFIDYSTARLRSEQNQSLNAFSEVNSKINTIYTTTNNIRIGAEWNLAPIKIRGGYALYGSPFKSGINDGKSTSYTAGFGFREKGYFLDFAYVYSIHSEDYYLYPSVGSETKLDRITNSFLMTLGFKF
ncbi:OmpP1/FadL family transporter [Bacteroidota bacterium]